jgi:hypothetical protein
MSNEDKWSGISMVGKRDYAQTWQLGCGELPRFSRDDGTIFSITDIGTISEESQKDEFFVPLMNVTGAFEEKVGAEQVVEYFRQREQGYLAALVAHAKATFPKLKDKDIEKYVVVRQDPTMFLESNGAYEEVAVFISIPLKSKKPLDLYDIHKVTSKIAGWGADFQAIALGRLDPTTLKWDQRATTAKRITKTIEALVDKVYELREKVKGKGK